jgi:hypothetical protein
MFEALTASRADVDGGPTDSGIARPESRHQGFAFVVFKLIRLVQCQDQRLAETGQPAQFRILCAGQVGAGNVDHGV